MKWISPSGGSGGGGQMPDATQDEIQIFQTMIWAEANNVHIRQGLAFPFRDY